MSGRERRISPRKPVALPVQFQVVEGLAPRSAGLVAQHRIQPEKNPLLAEILEGRSINLSERGIYFKTPASLRVGEPIELYFTLPRELTGRSPEKVRCNARVVHVDPDTEGGIVVGAAVERFEPLQSICDWDN